MFMKLSCSYCYNFATKPRYFSKTEQSKSQDKSSKSFLKDFGKNKAPDKVSIIGCGQVGTSICAYLIKKRLTKHLVMVDPRDDWVKAEALDFLHASSVVGSPTIEAGSDVALTASSKYIVITAGARPSGKSRLDVAQATADMLIKMVPKLVKHSPDATFIISSNPPDVMAWAIQKVTKLPKDRCISAGCHLDSIRFRYYIAQRLGVSASAVNAFIIGEHGDSSVPVWSGVNVAGISLVRVLPDIGTSKDKENWQEVHKHVIIGGREVSKIKGYTSWAIAISVGDILSAMMKNNGRICCVGTDVQGLMGIEDPIVLSLPCVLSSEGIRQVVELPLTKFEMEMFYRSAEALLKSQCMLKIPV